VLDIDGNGFAQRRNFGLQSMNGLNKEVVEQATRQALLLVTQPASGGNGLFDIKPVVVSGIQHGTKAEFEHEKGMFE
jgi:hypothetical protein